MYNFGELKSIVSNLVQRDGDTTYETQVGNWINLGVQNLYNIYDYWHELKGSKDFATVDGTAVYYMPMDFDKPYRLYDIENNKKITIFSEEDYFDGNIANIADAVEAKPDSFYFTEVVGVKRQVSTSGDTLQAKSSASESGSPVIRIEGYIDSDLTVIDYEEITVTGTTATTASSPKTFYKILNVSKDEDTSGYLTLEDSSGNDLSIIPSIGRIVRHKAFRFGRIPDGAYDMRVLYKKMFRKLVDDQDYPFVEADDYLTFFAASLAMQQSKETLDRAVLMQKYAQEARNSVLIREQNKLGPDYTHKLISGILQAHRS